MTPTMYLAACVSLVCPLGFPSGRSLSHGLYAQRLHGVPSLSCCVPRREVEMNAGPEDTEKLISPERPGFSEDGLQSADEANLESRRARSEEHEQSWQGFSRVLLL